MPRRSFVVLMILAVTALVPAVVVPLVLSDDPSTDQDPVAGGSPSATLPTSATATPSAATTSPVPINVAVSETTPAEGEGDDDDEFATLVLEAEAGRLRQAEVVPLGGGAGVRFTGESGEIEFESLDVPRQDRYRVTIVYASEGEWSIDIRGSANRERVELPRNADCCASITVSVRIGAGGDLTIEPGRGDGPFPTIDRILIDAT
jgi:hypothetical protein